MTFNFAELWSGELADDPVPDGTHQCEILSAEKGKFAFKQCAKNPEGISLKMRLQALGYAEIEEILPAHLKDVVLSLCAAAGVPAPDGRSPWDPEQLVGRRVTVKVLQRVAKSGKQYTAIVEYLPAQAELPAAPFSAAPPAKPRSQAAKSKAEFAARQDADDVPF